jgi:arylsulfatase A-like enzyme
VHRNAIAVLLALALLACSADGSRPSFILVVVDSLRADYLGSYGFRGDVSPNLDRLAAESLRFAQCIAQAPWTKPSMASLFTSAHPNVHGMNRLDDMFWLREGQEFEIEVLNDDFVTLAEALRDAGYRTSARTSNPWIAELNGFAQGFDAFRSGSAGGVGSADEVLAHVEALRATGPFFLYLHYMDVHAPYAYEEEGFAALRASPDVSPARRIRRGERQRRPRYMDAGPGFEAIDADDLGDWKALYATGVRLFDAEFGRLLDGLERTGALADTVLVVTSDHGEEFLEHGRTLCSHQLRVPLLIRWPDGRGAGRADTRVVRLIDLMPTLLAEAGASLPGAQVEGVDLFGLRERWLGGERAAFATSVKRRPNAVSIQDARLKLVREGRGGERLYDLAADPGETGSLNLGQWGEADHLRGRLGELLAQPSRRSTRASLEPLPEHEREAFRALGYLE